MSIEGRLGRVSLGDGHPVRIMAVINLSEESFYKNSVATTDQLLGRARSMLAEGADLIDLGAVSTAPGSPAISPQVERSRLIPALDMLLDALDVQISVDTMRSEIASEALSRGACAINDVSGLGDKMMARTVADHGSSLIIMASRERPGDVLHPDEIIPQLGVRAREAEQAGIDPRRIVLDPGIGRWVPAKTYRLDLHILDGFRRFRCLRKPLLAALSRKSFIGAVLEKEDPVDRLAGSLAATAVAVHQGAHIVRTHDVGSSLDTIRMAEAIRGRPVFGEDSDLRVEILVSANQPADMRQVLRVVGVDREGEKYLEAKGCFFCLLLEGLNPMESLVIKQEMLARGGDAGIPATALRCQPPSMNVLLMGNLFQINSLIRKLKTQPFRLPQIAAMVEKAVEGVEDEGRYG